MEEFGDRLTLEGSSGFGNRIAAAAAKAIEDTAAKGELIDTSEMREKMDRIVRTIQDTIPKPEDAQKVAEKVAEAVGATNASKTPALPTQQARLAPIVTSLAKVGGGGYTTGALDAQRENNRLTGETNSLLRESNQHLKKLGNGGSLTATFG